MRLLVWLAPLALAACTHDFTVAPGDGGSEGIPAGCVPPYVQMTTGCHRFVPTPATWADAEHACEADGGHLVVIDTVSEHGDIHTLTTTTDVWVAYTDRRMEATFRWVTAGGLDPQTNASFFGATGPPPGNSLAVNCTVQAMQNQPGDWHLVDCDVGHTYVCERDQVPVDPSSY